MLKKGSQIPGMKALLGKLFGYGNRPRRPLPTLDAAKADELLAGFSEIMEVEKKLAGLSS